MVLKNIKRGAELSIEHFRSIIGKTIWEILLVIVIILNVLDFFELLNPDFDYAKKIISWTVLGYLLYNIDLAKIIFGTSNKKFDFYLIIAYFFMIFKNFLTYSFSTIEDLKHKGLTEWAELRTVESTVTENAKNIFINIPTDIYGNLKNLPNEALAPVLNKIASNQTINNLVTKPTITIDDKSVLNSIYLNITNADSNLLFTLEPTHFIHRWHNFIAFNDPISMFYIQTIPFIIGVIGLIILSIYATKDMQIKKPSLMHIIHFERLRKLKYLSTPIRFLTIFFVLNFFFITVFNFMMEWLAIAIDASLLIAGVFFYIWINITHKHRFGAESLIMKLGDIGADFYERFIKLFHSEKGILLAFSGLIVLHLLTDLGIFLVPHATGIHDALYFEQISKETHLPIFNLNILADEYISHFTNDIIGESELISKIMILPLYLMNIISLIYLLAIPSFLWYSLLKAKEFNIPSLFIAIFYACIPAFILTPAFGFSRITASSGGMLNGIDITTRSIIALPMIKLITAILLSIALFIIVLKILDKNPISKQYFLLVGFIGSFIFLGYYVYIYIIEFFFSYTYAINSLLLEIVFNSIPNIIASAINIIIAVEFGIFMIITLMFYIAGYLIFLYEIIKG